MLAESQPYFRELEEAMKIRRYVKGKNVAQLPETIQAIIRGRQSQASEHEKRAEELISAAISQGRIYAAGDKLTLKISSVKDRIMPNGINEIQNNVFYMCYSLKKIILPAGLERISDEAFENCDNELVIGTADGLNYIENEAVRNCVISNYTRFSTDVIADIFIGKNAKSDLEKYKAFSGEKLNDLGRILLGRLNSTSPAKLCKAAASYIILYSNIADGEIIKDLFEKLGTEKNGAKAIESVRASVTTFAEKPQKSGKVNSHDAVEEAVRQKATEKVIKKTFKDMYNVDIEELPILRDGKGEKVYSLCTCVAVLCQRYYDR